jgi:hypothetical protein
MSSIDVKRNELDHLDVSVEFLLVRERKPPEGPRDITALTHPMDDPVEYLCVQ